MDWSWLDWAAVLVIGGVVGSSELISRYKDDPWAAIKSWPAIVYIAINGAASLGAHARGKLVENHGNHDVRGTDTRLSVTDRRLIGQSIAREASRRFTDGQESNLDALIQRGRDPAQHGQGMTLVVGVL